MVESGFKTKAYAALVPKGPLVPHEITRRAVGDDDVHIKIAFAGICHSDIHEVREEWQTNTFPLVPGHEIAGVVFAVGKNVKNFKVGDHAGVGVMVDSCRSCDSCKNGEENYCKTGNVETYNSVAKYPHCPEYNPETMTGPITQGGYSQDIVVHKDYVLSIPKNIPLAQAAPLLCAGITVYSPLKYYGIKAGQKLAVAGLGGLGSMAVKFGVALGCHVTVISRGTGKKEEALKNLGAHDFIDSTDKEAWASATERFDQILDTIAAEHDVKSYMSKLNVNGKLIMVGLPTEPISFGAFDFIPRRKSLVGSYIGGIRQTQEMLDFCGEKNIFCDVEVIKPEEITASYDKAVASQVKYRFSIDVSQM